MISFVNDYSENAFPEILEMLIATNYEGNVAYSNDEHSKRATALIREKIRCETADVQILMGGTQTNLVAFAAFLRPHEAVIAVHTGHICVHETGAIESTGHKCLEVKGADGKVISHKVYTAPTATRNGVVKENDVKAEFEAKLAGMIEADNTLQIDAEAENA